MGKQSQIGDALIAPIKSPKALWEIKRGRGDTSKELEKLEKALGNAMIPVDRYEQESWKS
jgi:hypothetical protein